jgi:hypothetical protein
MSKIKDQLKPKRQGTYRQGYYKVRHVEKYIGDPTKIIYRSSWEYRFCKFCDDNRAVLKWSSEPFPIKYMSPLDGREHNYYIDFYMKAIRDGIERDYLVEVKPESSLHKPVFDGKQTLKKLQQFNKAAETWLVNAAKFSAAREYARTVNYHFVIITEEFLFNQYGQSKGNISEEQ